MSFFCFPPWCLTLFQLGCHVLYYHDDKKVFLSGWNRFKWSFIRKKIVFSVDASGGNYLTTKRVIWRYGSESREATIAPNPSTTLEGTINRENFTLGAVQLPIMRIRPCNDPLHIRQNKIHRPTLDFWQLNWSNLF